MTDNGGVIVGSDFSWDDWFDLACNYSLKYGDLEVPARFKTSNGITYDENGKNLGMWVAKQRERCNPESERGKRLSTIGMRFSTKRRCSNWDDMFKLAKAYYFYHGDLEVPLNFITKDGVIFDDDGSNLGMWLYGQKLHCNPLSEHGKLLLSIGMSFKEAKASMGKKLEWFKIFSIAEEYFEKNGNLDVPRSYKTEDGFELGKWILRQRIYHVNDKLSDERFQMLESIGMIWEKHNNSLNVLLLCDELGIDTFKNESVLKHISFIIFNSKIAYLKDNAINLFDKNGILHEIFSMSSMNMKLKYGVSLEELINMYKEKSK